MTLKKFVELKATRDAIDEVMHFPKPSVSPQIKAKPRTLRYMLVGTAFDYLLRFMIERANKPLVTTKPWIAESALRSLFGTQSATVIDVDQGKASLDINSSIGNLDAAGVLLARQIEAAIKQAQGAHRAYLATGCMEIDLIRTSVLLAKLDFLCRSGLPPENFEDVDPEDVEDLHRLVEIAPVEQFLARTTCVLNPTFGKASQIVGGADGDLFIDGALIDIKTTKEFSLKKDKQREIVGYVVLATIGGIEGLSKSKSEVSRAGYYSARYGELVIYPIEEVLDKKKLPALARWFENNSIEFQAGKSHR